MHGQKRAEYKSRQLDPVVSAGMAKKALTWNTLSAELLQRRAAAAAKKKSLPVAPSSSSDDKDISSETKHQMETFALTEKLLTVNPDPGYLWNYRRELMLSSSPSSSSLFKIEEEVNLTTKCLHRNPKAYGAWFHRKWSIRHFLQQTTSAIPADSSAATFIDQNSVLQTELKLCGDFLQMDERNFHCWNYRRFVVSALAHTIIIAKEDVNNNNGTPVLDGSWQWLSDATDDNVIMGPQIGNSNNRIASYNSMSTEASNQLQELLTCEWEFTRIKIETNFSNCSAFHYRSKLLPFVLQSRLDDVASDSNNDSNDDRYEQILALAASELEMVQNAIFTEPDDQTPWWYHRFLLAWAAPPTTTSSSSTDSNTRSNIEVLYIELLQNEKNGIQELVEAEEGHCKWGLLAMHSILTALLLRLDHHDEHQEGLEQEAEECLDRLSIIDPDRSLRYATMKKN